MTDCTHVCPECASGKHSNCDAGAWCNLADEVTSCACTSCYDVPAGALEAEHALLSESPETKEQ